MVKRNTFFPGKLVLTILVPAFVILFSTGDALTAPQDAESRIRDIETRTDQIGRQLQQVRQNLNKTTLFAGKASAWTARLGQVEAEIRDLENQKQGGNFNIYDNRQLDDQLQFKRQQLESVRRLDGGQVIDGVAYGSIEELQKGMTQKGEEAMLLNNEYLKLTRQLLTLDQERDRLIDQSVDQERSRLEADKDRLQFLREDLEVIQAVVDSDRLWIMPGQLAMGSWVPHMSRELVIQLVTSQYLYEIQTTPGSKYSPQELASRIRNFRDRSDGLKRELRDSIIPETMREIDGLQRRTQRVTAGSPDIQGCWIILVGNGDYPAVIVTARPSGDYEAIITRVGRLDFFKQGNRLFSVRRINDDTYDGLEYSFTADGQPVEIPLRLVVSGDGASINYRSDSILVLRRCN